MTKIVNVSGFKEVLDVKDGDDIVVDAEGRIAVPSFYDMHVHLENALTLSYTGDNKSGTLSEAVERWAKVRDTLSKDDIKLIMKKAIILELYNGVTHIRTHADTCSKNLNSVKAALEVKEEMKDYVDIQVVAFPEQGVFNCDQEKFVKAIELADIIGGKPDGEDSEDLGKEQLRLIAELSLKTGKPIDAHIDQGDVLTKFAEYLLSLRHTHVALSHLTALHSAPREYAERLMSLIKRKSASVISSPLTTVYLNSRYGDYPKIRGITRIKEMLERDINVCLGHDDFQNPFFPLGFGDIIQALYLAVLLDQINPVDEVINLITVNAEREFSYASRPSKDDIVILDAKSIREQLSTLSSRFMVIRKGKIIAKTNKRGEVIVGGNTFNPFSLI
ncbi:amidohydrolase family protein [Stygiolobus azoricus]|uniref:Amidohydrolase family protein n=1 Tax=Stygiolobus azoricus TaxID=41675 RepID=A0A650CPK7_9CREN|nr:amidohydrolase family protein [Stygiolobus azoricus]QGR19582.1 amidohydrolase family protein [Stygiolobus azoricus]